MLMADTDLSGITAEGILGKVIHSLSFVFPMYNEEENIEIAVSEAIRVGYQIAPDIEIIVVDDASTDGSGGIIDRLADEHREVRAIHHKRNRKLGGALKTGFAVATKEWVLYMDSDLPVRMNEVLQAAALSNNADIVIGWRILRAESRWREFMSRVYNGMIRCFYGLRVRDVNFAFKLFRRSFLDRITLRSEGSFIDAELLLEMKRAGARFAEIGMHYYPRVAGKSTLGSPRVVLKIFADMIGYRLSRG
jgi:glycosyltransferase involved in cell wall biosynthesis